MNLDIVRTALVTYLQAAAGRGDGEVPVAQDMFDIAGAVSLAALQAELGCIKGHT